MQNNFIKNKLLDYFENEEKSNIELFNTLTLFIYQLESDETDLYMLAKKLPEEYLLELISYYDGDHIKMPTVEEFKDAKLLAFTFYMKIIKGKSWQEIKNVFDFPTNFNLINTISLGRKLTQIKDNLSKELFKALENSEFNDDAEEIKERLKK